MCCLMRQPPEVGIKQMSYSGGGKKSYVAPRQALAHKSDSAIKVYCGFLHNRQFLILKFAERIRVKALPWSTIKIHFYNLYMCYQGTTTVTATINIYYYFTIDFS